MTRTLTRSAFVVAAAVLLARPGPGAAQLSVPDLGFNPKDIDPFNKNSKLREGLREADRQRLDVTKDPAGALKDVFKKSENWSSEQLFVAYRDHVVSKNRHLKGQTLKESDDHYRMIQPVLGKDIDPKSVTFYFDAYVPNDMAGITFDNSVYIAQKRMPDNPYQGALLAHEMTHSVQYARLGGWKGFARRYAGQIGKSLRAGNFANVGLMHDSLDLEKEANATEVRLGESNPGGVAITNRTHHDVHYAIRAHRKAGWKSFSLKPGETDVHSYPLVLADGHELDPAIQFDHSYTHGFQGKTYALDCGFVLNQRRTVREAEAEAYHFSETSSKRGIDLFTGKGKAPPPLKTVKVSFTNDTKQLVAFHLNGGQGLETSLAPGKTGRYTVLIDTGVPPAVAIKQPKGDAASFGLVDGGDYEFRLDGGQVKNFYKGREGGHRLGGTWAGDWTNSLGEKGRVTLAISETEGGSITGTWDNVPVKGSRVDRDTIELTGRNATRSYRFTGNVSGQVLTLTYTATRLGKEKGSYDGKARLARESVER